MYLRSAPAMNAGLADVMMAPLMPGSVATRSMVAISSSIHSGETTFMGLAGSLRVMSAIPAPSISRVSVCMFSFSHSLDNRVGPKAVAGAQCDQRGIQIATLQFVERSPQNDRARGAERMTHGNGAAVDVDLGRINVEHVHVTQHHRREGLVDLEQI